MRYPGNIIRHYDYLRSTSPRTSLPSKKAGLRSITVTTSLQQNIYYAQYIIAYIYLKHKALNYKLCTLYEVFDVGRRRSSSSKGQVCVPSACKFRVCNILTSMQAHSVHRRVQAVCQCVSNSGGGTWVQ